VDGELSDLRDAELTVQSGRVSGLNDALLELEISRWRQISGIGKGRTGWIRSRRSGISGWSRGVDRRRSRRVLRQTGQGGERNSEQNRDLSDERDGEFDISSLRIIEQRQRELYGEDLDRQKATFDSP
jgi:hypothetical protein